MIATFRACVSDFMDIWLSKETEEDKKNTSGGSWGCGGGCGGGCIGGCGGGCL